MLVAQRRGIQSWILSGDDATSQAERDDAVVAQLPDRAVGMPRPAGLLHSPPGRNIGVGDPQRNDLVRSEPWLPMGLGDDQLHGLDSLLPCGVVPVMHTDEAVSVLPHRMLRALLARLEMEPDPCGDGGGRGPARRDAAGQAAAAMGGAWYEPLCSWTAHANTPLPPSDGTAYASRTCARTVVMCSRASSSRNVRSRACVTQSAGSETPASGRTITGPGRGGKGLHQAGLHQAQR